VGHLPTRRRLIIVAVADTHALIWAVLADSRLSPAARASMTVGGTDSVGVSAISLIEIVYLEEKKRLPTGVFARIEAAIATPGGALVAIPVDGAIARTLTRITRESIPDMPDRIIAATALHVGVPLVSRDGKIRASNIKTIW
jgi:PIN domain nuclease of toxin-antitoxin system